MNLCSCEKLYQRTHCYESLLMSNLFESAVLVCYNVSVLMHYSCQNSLLNYSILSAHSPLTLLLNVSLPISFINHHDQNANYNCCYIIGMVLLYKTQIG